MRMLIVVAVVLACSTFANAQQMVCSGGTCRIVNSAPQASYIPVDNVPRLASVPKINCPCVAATGICPCASGTAMTFPGSTVTAGTVFSNATSSTETRGTRKGLFGRLRARLRGDSGCD